MKRSCVVLSIGLIGGILAAGEAQAAWPWQKKPPAAVQAPAQEPSQERAPVKEEPQAAAPAKAADIQAVPVAPADLEKQRQAREKKKSLLNNNMWDIEITALNGRGPKQSDSITFRDNKFSSEAFGRVGFSPSNYTLTVQDDGTAVAETMQSGEKEGIVFWRVEFDREMVSCKGIYSRQLGPSKTEDYSFVSKGKKPARSVSPSAPAAAPQEEPIPVKAAGPVKKTR